MESYEILWKTTLPELEKTVTSISYETFIAPLFAVDIVGGKLVLCAQNEIFVKAVMGEQLAGKIKDALAKSNSEITDFVVYAAKSREEYLAGRENGLYTHGDGTGRHGLAIAETHGHLFARGGINQDESRRAVQS